MILALWLVYRQRENLLPIIELSPGYLFLSLLLAFFAIAATCLGHRASLDIVGTRIPLLESASLTVTGMMLNKVLPLHGGTVSRFGYLRYRYKMPFTRFTAGILAWLVVSILVAGICGLMATTFFMMSGSEPPLLFFAVFSLQTVLAGTVILLRGVIGKLLSKLTGHVTTESFLKDLGTPQNLLRLLIPAITGAGIFVVQVAVAFKALSLEVDMADAIITGLILFSLTRVAFTPGNIGVREILFAATFGAIGYGADQGVAIALITRGANLLAVAILGLGMQRVITRNIAVRKSG
ncbi:MAG: hypothetical protein DHS20C01_10910 [marine bacterium B5-7]|nr:MAG: hypothetical protein DHS20C01_10910 [marine bacterium B5-7]